MQAFIDVAQSFLSLRSFVLLAALRARFTSTKTVLWAYTNDTKMYVSCLAKPYTSSFVGRSQLSKISTIYFIAVTRLNIKKIKYRNYCYLLQLR
jgi:hypothetical protein